MTHSKKTNLWIVEDMEDLEVHEDVIDEEDLEVANDDDQFWYDVNEFKVIERVREYIVKGWLIAHGVTALLAKRGTGKSTVALDLSYHLACDMDWWGLPTMKDWCIIYICGEDDEGMILNCRAWEQKHERTVEADRFLVAKGIIKLTAVQELERRLEEMKEWARGRRCVVILDTWARATSGHSSNAQEEMDMAYENAEAVAEALNGPMIACFHPPKNGRELTIRGSAVQEDASSGIWNLEKMEDGILLTIQRAKGKGEGNWRKFRFEKVMLPGVDFYGDPLEGIVPIKVGGQETDTTTWIEQQRAAAKKADIERVAYANTVLDVVLADTDKQWTVTDMADAIKNQDITVDGHTVVVPGDRQTREKLPLVFAHPITLPDRGVVVSLECTGETGRGGHPIRYFKTEQIATNAGKSSE